MSATTSTAISPHSEMRPLRLRRRPRPDEMALLNLLASGPSRMTEGPVGRCSKRGWCRAVSMEHSQHGTGAVIVYELTSAGMDVTFSG